MIVERLLISCQRQPESDSTDKVQMKSSGLSGVIKHYFRFVDVSGPSGKAVFVVRVAHMMEQLMSANINIKESI